jgi:Na+/H+ antiporter NhaD/arsenite permease-like protein
MINILIAFFALGYLLIVLESFVKINKSAIALLMGVLCWSAYAIYGTDKEVLSHQLVEHLASASGILFFLLGAMTIVELVDAHDGFEIIRSSITTTNKRKLSWLLGLITFFLSAVLDNLTTTIVMVSLIRKIIPEKRDRLIFAGLIVIAANAGGAWSPIGDVTTTMLWIGGQVTASNIIIKTILPSLVSYLVPAIVVTYQLKGNIEAISTNEKSTFASGNAWERNLVFALGLASLFMVPVFKAITHLPPFMGVLIGLGLMWIVTEILHHEKDEAEKGIYSVNHALRKIDTPSILFFLGILLAISALESVGILTQAASYLQHSIGDIRIITILIGLLSAVVDNVPLVAAAQGMYGLDQFPTDHFFWEFLAYCSGTGGSILIIGSAAGVAAMGMEKINFLEYIKKTGWLALIGYLAGAACFLLLN